jgi:hypothetical protein
VTVRLLDTNRDIAALAGHKPAMNMLGFLDGQFDGFALVAAMAQNPAIVIDHLPAPLAGGIDMECVVAATRRHLNRRAVSG